MNGLGRVLSSLALTAEAGAVCHQHERDGDRTLGNEEGWNQANGGDRTHTKESGDQLYNAHRTGRYFLLFSFFFFSFSP